MSAASTRGVEVRIERASVYASGEPGSRGHSSTRSNRAGLSITKLTAGTQVTRQAVTKHLRLMEHVGLVRAARRGRESVWELEPERLEDARRCLDQISRQWDDALGRLRKLVER